MATRETDAIRDPATLRAFAHPLRLRLYEALLAAGPSTAAQLSRDVPGAPGSLSYHLRTLAKHGFVEEAPELAADGRERRWRAVAGGARWSEEDLKQSAGLRRAATSAQLMFLSRQQDRLRTWLEGNDARFGAEWRSAAVSSDVVLHLSIEELSQLGQDLEDFTDLWIARSRQNRSDASSDADVVRAPVFLVVHAFPFSVSPSGAGHDSQSPNHRGCPEAGPA